MLNSTTEHWNEYSGGRNKQKDYITSKFNALLLTKVKLVSDFWCQVFDSDYWFWCQFFSGGHDGNQPLIRSIS